MHADIGKKSNDLEKTAVQAEMLPFVPRSRLPAADVGSRYTEGSES